MKRIHKELNQVSHELAGATTKHHQPATHNRRTAEGRRRQKKNTKKKKEEKNEPNEAHKKWMKKNVYYAWKTSVSNGYPI